MQNDNQRFNVISAHGIDINVSNMEQALEEINELVNATRQSYVCFLEGNLFYRSQKERAVKDVINQATLIYPDGVSCAKFAQLFSGQNVERVSGPSFILEACRCGLNKNWRHFFLGGGDGVADKLAEKLRALYPNLQVAGCYCPPFRDLTEAEEFEVKKMIENNSTTLLWVGLGGPKQEFWMNKHLGKIDVPVMLGVGAAFDFHSGTRPWAPKIIRKLGLEWLYRAMSGGHKTFIRNLKCVSKVALILTIDKIKNRLSLLQKQELKSKNPCNNCDGIPCNLSIPYCPSNKIGILNNDKI